MQHKKETVISSIINTNIVQKIVIFYTTYNYLKPKELMAWYQ